MAARTAEKQRAEKLLEAGIKIDSVISDIFGVSGRDMLAALAAGEPALDERIAAQAAALAAAVSRLDEIPGISLASAYVILAGIGTGMTRFPAAGHLSCRARLAPGIKEPAGKKKAKARPATGTPTWLRAWQRRRRRR